MKFVSQGTQFSKSGGADVDVQVPGKILVNVTPKYLTLLIWLTTHDPSVYWNSNGKFLRVFLTIFYFVSWHS